MTTAENKIAVVIVAAGLSSRLGTPKQLLRYKGKPLLQHLLQVVIDSNTCHIIVVLGANADKITREIDFSNVQIVMNENWQEGMASSIRCGIQALAPIEYTIKGALIILCDQPHVTTTLVNSLITEYINTNKPIIASEYNGVLGAPALFHKSIFPELLQLKGDVGAKLIMQRYADEIITVAFSKGSVDIDTAADYEKLLKSSSPL